NENVLFGSHYVSQTAAAPLSSAQQAAICTARGANASLVPPLKRRLVRRCLLRQSGVVLRVSDIFPGKCRVALLLLRTSAIFCELTLTRGGCRDFRRGDGSERAVGRPDTSSNRLRFFAGLTIRIAYAPIYA